VYQGLLGSSSLLALHLALGIGIQER